MASPGHIDSELLDCPVDLQDERRLSGRYLYVFAAICHQNRDLGRSLTASFTERYIQSPKSPFKEAVVRSSPGIYQGRVGT